MEARKERTVWEMTTTREEFEAWAKDRGHFLSRHPVEGYLNAQTDAAWVAWQAAHLAGQRAMQERAAVAAWSSGMDQHQKAIGIPLHAREVGSVCARVIRALEVKPS